MTTQGTRSLLDLAAALKDAAPHVRECYDLGRGCKLMQRAAEVIERLAHLDPDIEVEHGEN